jgi:hypothetical protein
LTFRAGALFAGGSSRVVPNYNHVINLNILNILHASFIIIGRFTPRRVSLLPDQRRINRMLLRQFQSPLILYLHLITSCLGVIVIINVALFGAIELSVIIGGYYDFLIYL